MPSASTSCWDVHVKLLMFLEELKYIHIEQWKLKIFWELYMYIFGKFMSMQLYITGEKSGNSYLRVFQCFQSYTTHSFVNVY